MSPDPDVKLMFPLVQGLVAFDTPYNGLSRSMFAYGAFSQYQNISSLWNLSSSVGSLLTASGGGAAVASNQIAANSGTSWRRWQTLASRSGTYGAIIAGGVAAYMNRAQIAETLSRVNKENISESWAKVNRENITQGLGQIPAYVSRDSVGEGFAWMAGHLKFVGALMKQAQLTIRLERLSQLKGIGVTNFYTSLGENGYWSGGYFFPKRTFCAIPTGKDELRIFREQPNTKSSDEIAAHCSMFRPEKNPLYQEMTYSTRDIVLEWVKNDPRKVVDDYKPDQDQRSRSMSEAHLFDDDGKVLNQHSETTKGESEDELQLQAILTAPDMPQSEDGGINDEDLKRAMGVPLPQDDMAANGGALDEASGQNITEEEAVKTWRSRIPNPFGAVSIPAVRIPTWGAQKEASSATDEPSRSGTENPVSESSDTGIGSNTVEAHKEVVEDPLTYNAVQVTTKELSKEEIP